MVPPVDRRGVTCESDNSSIGRSGIGLYEMPQELWRHRVSFLLSLGITILAFAVCHLIFLHGKRRRCWSLPAENSQAKHALREVEEL